MKMKLDGKAKVKATVIRKPKESNQPKPKKEDNA